MNTEKKSKKAKKPVWKEWLNSIVFAVVVASLFRSLFMEGFAIPTSSMENSLLVGDHLFVSKLHYGSATPRTPLQLPLIHQYLPGTKIPEYLDWVELPYFRLPGFRDLKRSEEVVFHYPPEWDRPVDMKTFYVKRCIAIPGDSLEINAGVVWVNGQVQLSPENGQSSYRVITEQLINPRIFRRLGIDEYYSSSEGYQINAETDAAIQLEAMPFVNSVEAIVRKPGWNTDLYPSEKSQAWSTDYYGPIYLPKPGDRIDINPTNLALYGTAILHYEGVDAKIEGDVLYVDGKTVDEYVFKQGYYFMMGDNRHNSLDSRFWGFVPEDHIVGKPVLVWFSYDKKADWPERIRWGRLFTLI